MKIRSFLKYASCLFVMMLSACNSTPNYKNEITIYKLPNTIHYYVGDTFSLEGLQVIDKFGLPVSDYKSSIKEGSKLKQEGTLEVEISKRSFKPGYFKIDVVVEHMLEISKNPAKTTYFVGEPFDISGLEVTDENKKVIQDFDLSIEPGFIFRSVGEVDVEISKTDYRSTNFKLNIESERQLEIKHMPNKSSYKAGDAFDDTGLVVGDNKGATDLNYTLSMNKGDILKYVGQIPVKVMVDGYEPISFDIKVEKNSSASEGKEIEFDIYYMNDTHGAFSRNSSDGEAGMAYISSYIKEKVSQNPNDLVLSGGDMFQGGIECNQTRGKIMVDAMNEIGFDAMALGNHELDWGEDVLKNTLKLANFPVISCNTFYSDRISVPEWITPYTVIQKQDITVGVIGFARYYMGSSILASVANQFYFPKAGEYIKKYSRELRLSYNCDVVLAVGHDEGANSSDIYLDEIESVTYTDSVTGKPYVDGLMFAHDHATQSGRLNGIPYMEAACNGKKLGVLNYKLEYNGVLYEPKSNWVTILNAYDTCRVEDPAITALLEKYSDEIGDVDSVLYNFERSYNRDELVRIVCQAMAWYVNNNKEKFGNETVYIASHNYGGVRVERVSAGPFTNTDLIEMMPFENILAIQKCTKKQVETLQSDSYYRTYTAYVPVYVNSVTTCVTISYIAEAANAPQQSFKEYPPYTARDALVEFFKSGEPIRI